MKQIQMTLFVHGSAYLCNTTKETCRYLGWSDKTMTIPFLFENKNFFDTLDFITANLMLPLGGLFIAVFVGWRWSYADAVETAGLRPGTEPVQLVPVHSGSGDPASAHGPALRQYHGGGLFPQRA